MDSNGEFIEKQKFLKERLDNKRIKYRYHDGKAAVVEAALSRGDRRVFAAILNAWRAGARFDGWSEYFDAGLWERAFHDANLDVGFYALRERDWRELLPWDFIDMGISRDFFLREDGKAQNGETTPNCMEGCGGCGIAECAAGAVCYEP